MTDSQQNVINTLKTLSKFLLKSLKKIIFKYNSHKIKSYDSTPKLKCKN